MNETYPNIKDGRKVVTTAGTRERLSSVRTICRKVEITAEVSNTDYVVIGGNTVIAAGATRQGVPLMSGQTLTMYVSDLYDIFIDSVVNGEGVTFIYYY